MKTLSQVGSPEWQDQRQVEMRRLAARDRYRSRAVSPQGSQRLQVLQAELSRLSLQEATSPEPANAQRMFELSQQIRAEQVAVQAPVPAYAARAATAASARCVDDDEGSP